MHKTTDSLLRNFQNFLSEAQNWRQEFNSQLQAVLSHQTPHQLNTSIICKNSSFQSLMERCAERNDSLINDLDTFAKNCIDALCQLQTKSNLLSDQLYFLKLEKEEDSKESQGLISVYERELKQCKILIDEHSEKARFLEYENQELYDKIQQLEEDADELKGYGYQKMIESIRSEELRKEELQKYKKEVAKLKMMLREELSLKNLYIEKIAHLKEQSSCKTDKAQNSKSLLQHCETAPKQQMIRKNHENRQESLNTIKVVDCYENSQEFSFNHNRAQDLSLDAQGQIQVPEWVGRIEIENSDLEPNSRISAHLSGVGMQSLSKTEHYFQQIMIVNSPLSIISNQNQNSRNLSGSLEPQRLNLSGNSQFRLTEGHNLTKELLRSKAKEMRQISPWANSASLQLKENSLHLCNTFQVEPTKPNSPLINPQKQSKRDNPAPLHEVKKHRRCKTKTQQSQSKVFNTSLRISQMRKNCASHETSPQMARENISKLSSISRNQPIGQGDIEHLARDSFSKPIDTSLFLETDLGNANQDKPQKEGLETRLRRWKQNSRNEGYGCHCDHRQGCPLLESPPERVALDCLANESSIQLDNDDSILHGQAQGNRWHRGCNAGLTGQNKNSKSGVASNVLQGKAQGSESAMVVGGEILDIYRSFFILTAQCVKLNSRDFNKAISVYLDLDCEYEKVLAEQVPINGWDKHLKNKIEVLLGEKI